MRWGVLCAVAATLLIGGQGPGAGNTLLGQDASARQQSTETLSERIARLIGELGAAKFTTREQAEAELSKLGLPALDALNEAQNHDDIEIAMRARRLVRTIEVDWTRDSDATAVKRLLDQYGRRSAAERQLVMERLASLPNQEGYPALCRLARFEPSLRLAKRAALFVMRLDASDLQEPRQLAAALEEEAQGSSRTPVEWLRSQAVMLRDPGQTVDLWEQLVREEEQTYALFPEQTSRVITRDLLRRYAEVLLARERRDAAADVVARLIPLVDADQRNEVVELVDWLLAERWWHLVEAAAQRFARQFQADPPLAYRLAEAQQQAGRIEESRQTAKRAAQESAQGGPEIQLMTAASLQNDGLFEWAEYAFRHLIEDAAVTVEQAARARFYLSEMLYDQEKYQEAASVLSQMLEALSADDKARRVIETAFGQPLSSFECRRHYFLSLVHKQAGQVESQVEQLRKAVELDPNDPDVLIAMYRLDRDASWRAEALQRVQSSVEHFRQEVEQAESQIAAGVSPNEHTRLEQQIAFACNQLAWVIANTEGDTQYAIRCSQRSLEIHPDSAGMRDTLARCYFAHGDLERAVAEQQTALRMEPHNLPMQKQLELFQRALQEQETRPMQEASGTDGAGQPDDNGSELN